MQPTTREKIGVTQQAFSAFLNISISQLSMAEIHKRSLPAQALFTVGQIDICLLQAPSSLPADKDMKLLNTRYKTCLLQLAATQRKLEKLQQQYTQCINAITVATHLPKALLQPTPEQTLWLQILANDAQQKLNTCGTAQQQLLQLKIASLEAEIAALSTLINAAL